MNEWQCQRSGHCCTVPTAVVVRVEEWRELESHTPIAPVVLDRTREAQGWIAIKARPCPFFDHRDRTCSVYDVRPYNCRRFMCGRWDVTKEPFTDSARAIAARIAGDNDLRWSLRRTLQRARAWALAHGWTPNMR